MRLAFSGTASLPTPQELYQELPLTSQHKKFIFQSRSAVEAILNREDSRRLLIIGPCSIHDPASAIEYAKKFHQLSKQVSDKFFMIMRTYFEKPRTIIGWKGLLYDPDLDGSYNLLKGIRQTRELLYILTEMGVPVGCELLEINTTHYYSDFLTWGCIGARTCASPPHRQLAASLSLPIGFKNTIDGNIDHAIQGILAAASQHVYLGLSPQGKMMRIHAHGNPLCHVILRGGITGTNYHAELIHSVMRKCRQASVRDQIIIDCSHDNCGKQPLQQIAVFESVVQQILEGNTHIVGIMLESHLEGGCQEITFPLIYGVSITDPCIDWNTTQEIIITAYENLKKCYSYI